MRLKHEKYTHTKFTTELADTQILNNVHRSNCFQSNSCIYKNEQAAKQTTTQHNTTPTTLCTETETQASPSNRASTNTNSRYRSNSKVTTAAATTITNTATAVAAAAAVVARVLTIVAHMISVDDHIPYLNAHINNALTILSLSSK